MKRRNAGHTMPPRGWWATVRYKSGRVEYAGPFRTRAGAERHAARVLDPEHLNQTPYLGVPKVTISDGSEWGKFYRRTPDGVMEGPYRTRERAAYHVEHGHVSVGGKAVDAGGVVSDLSDVSDDTSKRMQGHGPEGMLQWRDDFAPERIEFSGNPKRNAGLSVGTSYRGYTVAHVADDGAVVQRPGSKGDGAEMVFMEVTTLPEFKAEVERDGRGSGALVDHTPLNIGGASSYPSWKWNSSEAWRVTQYRPRAPSGGFVRMVEPDRLPPRAGSGVGYEWVDQRGGYSQMFKDGELPRAGRSRWRVAVMKVGGLYYGMLTTEWSVTALASLREANISFSESSDGEELNVRVAGGMQADSKELAQHIAYREFLRLRQRLSK